MKKVKPFLYGSDKPQHTKEDFTFSLPTPPTHTRIIKIKNPRKQYGKNPKKEKRKPTRKKEIRNYFILFLNNKKEIFFEKKPEKRKKKKRERDHKNFKQRQKK
jgi:hypothetical protein